MDPADSRDFSIRFVRTFFKKVLYITSTANIESITEHKHSSKALFVSQRIIADYNKGLASRMRARQYPYYNNTCLQLVYCKCLMYKFVSELISMAAVRRQRNNQIQT